MTLAVNVDQKMYASGVGGPSMGKFRQRSTEVITFAVDYSGWLDPSDTITIAPSFSISPPSSALPLGTFPNLIANAAEISTDGREVYFQVSGGQDGTKYEIVVSAQTATGQVKQDYFYVTVGSHGMSAAVGAQWYMPMPPASAAALGGVMSASAPAKKFMTGIAGNGMPTFAQPDFSDLSGSATKAQLPALAFSDLSGSATKAQLPALAFSDLGGFVAPGQLPAATTASLGAVIIGAGLKVSAGTVTTAQRTAVNNAAYAALATDQYIAYTAIAAARTVTLPAASAYQPGQPLTIADESGSCSLSLTISLAPNGTDKIQGANASLVVINQPRGYVEVVSDGAGSWTVIDSSTQIASSTILGGVKVGSTANVGIDGTIFDAVGFRNRIINGNFLVDQRNSGASVTVTAGGALLYTIDRWWAACTGANVTAQRIAGTAPNQYLYQFTGAAGVTGITFGHRISAVNSQDLAGRICTLSLGTSNSLLGIVTWAAYYATTTDTFGTLASPTKTLIATGTFNVTGALSSPSIGMYVPAAATTGIEIIFSVGAQVSGSWNIGVVQFEPGEFATTFERRPYSLELYLAQWFYRRITTNGVNSGVYGVGSVVGATLVNCFVTFPQMRAPPAVGFSGAATFSSYSAAISGAPSAISVAQVTSIGMYVTTTVSGYTAGQAGLLRDGGAGTSYITLDAEL